MKNKIHIWNLPIERVYIKLKDGFREEFFEKAHKKFGSWTKLGKFLNVKTSKNIRLVHENPVIFKIAV